MQSAAVCTFLVCTFLEYSLVDFFAVYRDLTRRLDPNNYLMTFHAHYCDGDIVIDNNFLINAPCHNKHSIPVALTHYYMCETKKVSQRALPS